MARNTEEVEETVEVEAGRFEEFKVTNAKGEVKTIRRNIDNGEQTIS